MSEVPRDTPSAQLQTDTRGNSFMARIFISYRRDDSAYVAAMLAQRLRAAFGPDSVYIDIDAIPLGIDFRQHIQNAVHKCDVLLALVGQRWLSVAPDSGRRRIDDPADFVRIEIEAAIRRDIPVVPVLIDNAPMPSADELPEPISPLAFRNAAELRAGRDMDHHLELLVGGLRQLLPAQPLVSAIERRHASVSEGPAGRLRFVRDKSLGGSALAFRVELDGRPVGELRPGETLDCPASAGSHHVKVGHSGALFDASMDIDVGADQTRVWDVSLGWTGTVKLSER